MSTELPQRYQLNFTGATVRPELARIIAEYFLRHGDWGATIAAVRTENALQCRSANSADNMERELRQRIQTLTKSEITLLASATADDRTAVAWLAVLKRYAFVFEFVNEVLAPKHAALDPVLRPSDYESFVDRKALTHPELLALTPSSAAKIRQVLTKMLTEAGLLTKGAALGTIRRPVLSPQVVRAIEADSPHWLAGFLVPEHEVYAR